MIFRTNLRVRHVRPLICLAALAAGGLCLSSPLSAEDSSPTIVAGQTKPSEENRLAFAAPGIVTEVLVKEGNHIKPGDVLAKQDDRQDLAALQSIKLEADSTVKIDYSVADRNLKKAQLDRYEEMYKKQAASILEVEEKRLAVVLAETQIDLAKLEHDQKIQDAKKQQARVDQLQIKSPYEGTVEMLNVHTGEMADPQNRDGAIVVVKNDPLWVEVRTLPTAQVQQLKLNQEMQVKYPGDKDWQTAKICYIRPQADAASNTQLFRLALPNPTGRDSGQWMQVKLPDNIAAVAAGGDK